MVCKYCGASPALDSKVALHRISPKGKGTKGIWVCDSTACVLALDSAERDWYERWRWREVW